MVQVSSQLILEKVLYVLDFLVNLISNHAITKVLNYCVTFFPFHDTFQDLQTEKRIGLDHERGYSVYLLTSDEIL